MISLNVHRGNLLKFDSREFRIISVARSHATLDSKEYGIMSTDWKNIDPVPITKEYFIEFGAQLMENGHPEDADDYYQWYEKRLPVIGCLLFNEEEGYLYDIETETVKIEYVHQLQNLINIIEEICVK